MKKRPRPNQIVIDLRPDVRSQLDDIEKLARIVNPKTSRAQVIMHMISDLHARLSKAGALPLPAAPTMVDATSLVRRNGNGSEEPHTA